MTNGNGIWGKLDGKGDLGHWERGITNKKQTNKQTTNKETSIQRNKQTKTMTNGNGIWGKLDGERGLRSLGKGNHHQKTTEKQQYKKINKLKQCQMGIGIRFGKGVAWGMEFVITLQDRLVNPQFIREKWDLFKNILG